MEQRKSQLREPAQLAQVNQLLAGHYQQLLKWGAVLTRGDSGQAEEIVQELCLYFTLTKPDLSDVANLNGYLYTCLRHIYLSGLARSSREALHVVSVAEYDCLDFALSASRSGDPLQRQNDLRRICGYAVWRKESSKSASCFIFHFFHGYGRREIAELACLPLAGVYNNLKIARAEVKSYLEEPGKLRLVNRELPSEPTLAWSLLPSAEIFNELRETILHGRTSACLSEEELLGYYRSPMPRPISCSLLAHIVSCEPCLAVVDRYFGRPTLEDREPLDGFSASSESSNGSVVGPTGVNQTMLPSVHKRWVRFHEHRPRTLSIAVDGQIIAFHDVQVRHSTLSARIEYPERARFVEVFSEQDLRLALLPVGELPPEGPYTRTQRVTLSDSRWLELNLTFDGQGLNTQVAYFDPVLVIEGTEEVTEESSAALEPKPGTPIRAPGVLFWLRALARIRHLATPSSAIAWALTLAVIFGTAGYLAYRHLRAPLDADEILNTSVKTEAANLRGQTEHQVLRIEEVSAGGEVLQQGMVDVWKDGDGGRSLRRLFDSQHRVIAARWRNKNGEHSSEWGERGRDASTERLLMNDFWDQDLSAHGFSLLAGKATRIRAVDGGYELMTAGSNEERPHLVSATLVLDRHLHPVREVMRLRDGAEIRELRFVQEVYERRPSASVPDTLFDPVDEQLHSSKSHGLLHQHSLPGAEVRDVQLAELQIAVLYQLNALGADTGEPIEVTRTGDGHIRVAGTVADDALKQKIASQTKMLMNHQLIELRLLSPRDVHLPAPSTQRALSADASVYDVRQPRPTADVTVRGYFQAMGLSGERLDSAVAQFSLDAVQHAQRALQNAYALERLGSTVSGAELQSISLSSQQQWTAMVDSHASELEEQLRALDAQLAKILPSREDSPSAGAESLRVENPEQFNRAANKLLRQMQDLNREVGEGLTSNASGESSPGQNDLLERARNGIPLRQVEEITSFAGRLNVSAKAASVNR